tara:strand:- start:7468 stop:11382 length:3915 start_codon:yes stop_codon:yes gene_type:complete
MSNSNNLPISFQIIDWYSGDYQDADISSEESTTESDSDENQYKRRNNTTDTSKYKIYIFGKDLNEKTYTLEVNGFTPYFYIKLPDGNPNTNKAAGRAVERFVKKELWSKYKECLLGVTVLYRHSFRNFDNKKLYRFARLKFSNLAAMRKAVNIFQNSQYNASTGKSKKFPKEVCIYGIPGTDNTKYQYDLYENNIDPLLKFIHHSKIKPVGWLQISPNNYTHIFSDIAKREYHSDYAIQANWLKVKPKTDNNNSSVKIMAYDIECDSSHGDFPLPKKDCMKTAREIYNSYMKLNQKYIKLRSSNNLEYKNIESELENRLKFAKNSINAALKLGGSVELEISELFLKNKTVSKTAIKLASDQIAPLLTVSTSNNSIERKKHSTKTINTINKILNQTFGEVEGDQTIQIGMSFLKYGDSSPYKNYMLTYDPTGTCDKISNATTESFKSESELLLRFKKLIMKEDPDIITGWNTDGFDTPWLFKRAQELEIDNIFNYMSRMKSFESVLNEKHIKGPTGELIKKEFVDIPGRIQMDMLPLVQKGFNLDSYKLDNVSANFINGKIANLVYDKSTDKTLLCTNSVIGLNNGNYIVLNEIDGYLENKYKDGKKFQISNLDKDKKTFEIEGSLDINKDLYSKYSWCLGKDDISPQDIFNLQKKGPKERSILAYYCMMDVILCHELLLKLSLLTNNIGMANVCLNPLAWIIHRGQGIKILSLTAYFLKQRNYVLPYLYKDSFDKEGFEGAVVLDPNPGIYINAPVAVLDYGSLYPSSMIERNLSHDSIVHQDDHQYLGEEGAKRIKELGYFGHEDITYDIFKTIYTSTGTVKGKIKVGEKTVRFVQYSDPCLNGEKGIIPELERYLLTARKNTRTKIKYKTITCKSGEIYTGVFNKISREVKTPEDKVVIPANDEIISITDTYTDFEKEILDGLQLAFKVTANSLYGQLGAKTSDVYYKEIAAATTATGRERLVIAQKYAEDKNNYPQKLNDGTTIYLENKVVYGDTDSIFIRFQTLDNDGKPLIGRDSRIKSIELAQFTEKEIQKTKLRHPQVLEYEKTFDPFILLSKKRYVGDLYEVDPDKYKLKSMGIVLKRRDNAPIVKIIYGGIIDIIMKQKSILPAIDFLRRTLRDLVKGKYGLDTLVLSKTLSSYYKDPDRIAHKVLADRMAERDPGNKPQINDRIPFVYITTDHLKQQTNLLQGDKIENPEYIIKNNLTPDYEFYITNQIMKPVSQIFGLCLKDLPGFPKTRISEFDNIYKNQLSSGKTVNESIKKMLDSKNKEAGKILFRDILRILENKRMKNTEITSFFNVRK